MSKMGNYIREEMEAQQVDDVYDLMQNSEPFVKVFADKNSVDICCDEQCLTITPAQVGILIAMLGRL